MRQLDLACRAVERLDVDAAVVGAGLAGLTAGSELHRNGQAVVVLEARDRVGGRVLNHDLGDGRVVEVGGQWIGPGQRRMERLVTQLGLETFPTHNTGEHLLAFGDKRSRYRGTIPQISPFVLADMGQAQTRFDRMARQVPLEAPWIAPRAESWDATTFETWIQRNARTKHGRDLLRLYCEAVFAVEPRDLSLLHALFYTHSGGGMDRLAGTNGGAQQDRIVGGSQRFAFGLAERVGAEHIRFDTPVRRIEQWSDDVTVHAEGVTVRARHVIVAIPPTLAGRIDYEPALPAYRDQLTQRVPAGSVIKCNAIYGRPFWRDDGLTGQATSDHGPVKVAFDNSPPDGSIGILLGFLEGDHARTLNRATPADRRAAVLRSLADLFGDRALHPIDYVELDWSEEEWTRGCYGAHFPTGVWTRYGPALSAAIGRIHWAGAETATVWSGYMDGAVQSGERAAAEVLAAR